MRSMRSQAKNRRGQSMAEYAMLLAFVLAFIMAISMYFKNNMAGTIRAGVDNYTNTVNDQLGVAVVAYAPQQNSNVNSSDASRYNGSGSMNSNSLSNSISNSVTKLTP